MTLHKLLRPPVLLPLLLVAWGAQAQSLKPVLMQATAKRIADGCEAYARREGLKMNIAIVDEGGNLKHFTRMDDSYLKSIHIAQLKAETSAGFPFSTRVFRDASKGARGLEMTPGTTTVAGGLSIMTSTGKHLGGIGVSGGTEDQDESCAKAGLDAAADLLK